MQARGNQQFQFKYSGLHQENQCKYSRDHLNLRFVTGTFNGWKTRVPLEKSDQDFSVMIQMPLGTQPLKFIVDDEWKCSTDLPIASDNDGNLVNYLQISLESSDIGDGLDDISESFKDMKCKS